ncbi:AP-2 complex subunit beta [Thelohanellus kitauei]|uniref:AP-2 complex subunit beta n=1 Tax=Thelohanellus kitauei TaxID=669202 RepID=A0A0C2MJ64_THEKT|nr:AP-2 complex subunit beta [Thelohanellus kitauei]
MNEKTYFSQKEKTKILKLKNELGSDKKDRKIETLRKIIHEFMSGNDMSDLFPDIIKLLHTDSCELKKLVYLYLINYSKTRSDMAILAINTFVRDCSHSEPLIRALAVRTMGNMLVTNATEHLCDPLRKCLEDQDPYVRKTAAICVLKLFHYKEELVYEFSLIKVLVDLLDDTNAAVLSNAVIVLNEIFTKRPSNMSHLTFNMSLVNRLLSALNDCSEWGQSAILDFLVLYKFGSEEDAVAVAERVVSRLSHANCAVVSSTIRLIFNCIKFMDPDSAKCSRILSKLSPPLISFLSLDPEIQYVALRNINLIIQKYPALLQNELASFFVKYNDPLYIKIEKLEILLILLDENNVNKVLDELKDYAADADVEFVKKTINGIGTCALKVESSSDQCVSILIDLIETKISYVVQQSIIVARDILRKFPAKYESILQKIGENLMVLDDDDARAALIWIVGEYGDRIENCGEIISVFCQNFIEESSKVQLQTLTAVVKIFLKRPQENSLIFEEIVTLVQSNIDNPDIRDRCLIYCRLVKNDLETARKIILAPKPILTYHSHQLSREHIETLIPYVTTLYSVYHRIPASFSRDSITLQKSGNKLGLDTDLEPFTTLEDLTLKPLPLPHKTEEVQDETFLTNFSSMLTIDNDLQHVDFWSTAPQHSSPSFKQKVSNIPTEPKNVGILQGHFGISEIYTPEFSLLSAEIGKALKLYGQFTLDQRDLYLNLKMVYNYVSDFTDFSLQINANYFGISLKEPRFQTLSKYQEQTIKVPVNFDGPTSFNTPIDVLQMSLKANTDVYYFCIVFPIHFYFLDPQEYRLDAVQFYKDWSAIQTMNKMELLVSRSYTFNEISSKLKTLRMKCIQTDEPPAILATCILRNKCVGLVKVIFSDNSLKINIGSSSFEIIEPTSKILSQVFS